MKGDRITVILHKAKGGNWAHITKADAAKALLKKEKSAARSDDPSAGIMDMMRTMYDEGDDDMKRLVGGRRATMAALRTDANWCGLAHCPSRGKRASASAMEAWGALTTYETRGWLLN